jgi:hypothetical protein
MQGIPGQKQTRPMEEYYDNIDKKDPRSAVAIPKVGSLTKYTIFTFAKSFFREIFMLQLRKVLEFAFFEILTHYAILRFCTKLCI